MTLQIKKSGNYTYLYAIKSFRKEDGKCTTKVVEKFGTVEELREKLNGADPIEWARARVAEMTAIEKEENKRVVVEYDPKAYIRKGEQRFIKAEHCTTDGELAQIESYSLNQEMIDQESRFDGFYALCTDLADPAPAIIRLNGARWTSSASQVKDMSLHIPERTSRTTSMAAPASGLTLR